MPGVSALTVSLTVCITVSLRQPRGPGARPRGWSWLCALHSPGGRLAGRVRAGGAARVGGRGRAPCSAGDCAFRPGSPRLPGCAEVEAAMATIPLAGQHSGRWAQLGSRLQHGGGRAALRPAGRWEAAGPDQRDSEAGGSGEQAELGLTGCAPVLACSLQEAPRL